MIQEDNIPNGMIQGDNIPKRIIQGDISLKV